MKQRGSELRHVCRVAVAALAVLAFGCSWTAWIPGESSWNPDVVVDPSRLAVQLTLDTTFVDELGCYSHVCDKRFRLVVDHPGTLTVRALFELVSQDQQARMVLESPRGVLGQAHSGRGPRADASPLIIRASVGAGTYFVLIQSIGGGGAPTPYELTATLTREDVTALVLEEVEPGSAPLEGTGVPGSRPSAAVPMPTETPRRMVRTKETLTGGGGYDPAVIFTGEETFAFPSLAEPGDDIPAGTPLLGPEGRQVRRFLAEALEQKGFRQPEGHAQPDLLVEFSTDSSTRHRLSAPLLLDFYGFGPIRDPNMRGRLVVDIVDLRSNRIAWHAYASFAAGPGVVSADETTPELRRAVTDVMAGFPPH